jgi:hypothetical protein
MASLVRFLGCLVGPADDGPRGAALIQMFSWNQRYLRLSGERRLAIHNEYVLVVRQPGSKSIVLSL